MPASRSAATLARSSTSGYWSASRSSFFALCPSEGRPRRRHDEVADAEVGGEAVAVEEDLSQFVRRHEVRVAERLAVLLEGDPHPLVDVRLHVARRDVDYSHALLALRFSQALGEGAHPVLARR